ncbi:MAG TPA: hypothetical protein DCM05_09420 [Elusimicrobia bacterium]|nr:hypothetical protein [Elusimicrobiota bacterium]
MSDAVKRLEEARDVAGLEDILRHPRFETLGEVQLKGEAARRAMDGLPYTDVRVMDMGNLRRVDVSVDERLSACGALGRIATREAAKALIGGLGDPVPKVGKAVMAALEAVSSKLLGRGVSIDTDVSLPLALDEPIAGIKLVEAQAELERFFEL